MEIKTVKILLKGKVQGVFFRDFAKQNANKLGITGYAKNLKNGELEIVAHGDARKIDEYARLCKKGPIFAKVESAKVEDMAGVSEDEYEYFDIRYS